MRKFVQAVKSFVVESLNCVAPYTVYNVRFMKKHYAWSFNGALSWLSCYDATDFGPSYVTDFNGEIIASKGI